MKKSLLVILLAFGSCQVFAADIDLAGDRLIANGSDVAGNAQYYSASSGRLNIGWGGDGGGNLEAYSKNHSSRAGEFKFIYGGGSLGSVIFTHYDGSNWSNKMKLESDGTLRVAGNIVSNEINVKSNVWSDYVFDDTYKLMPLSELEAYISDNKHLPEIPTSEDVAKNGIDIGAVSAKLLAKVEELTLHVIALKKENVELLARIKAVESGD